MRYFLIKTIQLSLVLVVLAAAAVGGIVLYGWHYLPSIDNIRDIQLQEPLRIYTRDGLSLAEYGEKRRIPLAENEIPKRFIQALLAAEDDRFYEHSGVDFKGLLRAAVYLVKTGEKGQGGSTITMQMARNFYLNRNKNFRRKFDEILLSFMIERSLTKDEILALYLNKIFFGHRAYGVGAAAAVYYGKDIQDLNIAQYAMLAGIPKHPSTNNPLNNPPRALERRNYILGRMKKLGYIDNDIYKASTAEPVTADWHRFTPDIEAHYVAEMARQYAVKKYGEAATTRGYHIYTTIDGRLQTAAQKALRSALLAYDQRHGYRGVLQHVTLPTADSPATRQEKWNDVLAQYPVLGGLQPALVLEVTNDSALVYTEPHGHILLDWDALSWARPYLTDHSMGPKPKQAGDILKPGDVVLIQQLESPVSQEADKPAEPAWQLAQIPNVEGALVSLNPNNGAIISLVGGFDYRKSNFNRVMQAKRQPGSNIKPFVYSAALENGYGPASLINDAPLVFGKNEDQWKPNNYGKEFRGPTRLREALADSRNLVSIRMVYDMGVPKTIKYIKRFGLNTEALPRDLTLSLGSGTLTPVELVRGIATFANGGYLIKPHFIDRIKDNTDRVVHVSAPETVCRPCELGVQDEPRAQPVSWQIGLTAEDALQHYTTAANLPPAPRIITPQNAWLMDSMLKDVIRMGTGRKAKHALKRKDIAGKTGTTNDQRDAWFSGYNTDFATTAWVGFDTPRPLGRYETGGQAALPMWIDFMKEALDGVPETLPEPPPGLVTVRIDPKTGLLAHSDTPNAVFETFRAADVPTRYVARDITPVFDTDNPNDVFDAPIDTPEQIF